MTAVQKSSGGQAAAEPHENDDRFGRGETDSPPHPGSRLLRGDVLPAAWRQRTESGRGPSKGFLQVLMRGDATTDDWKVEPPSRRIKALLSTHVACQLDDRYRKRPGATVGPRDRANRVWQHHFGTGIVSTPNDFGVQGQKPTHPELLDWLAQYLIDNDWRLKPVHKLIMTSAAYTQSSRVRLRRKQKPICANQYLVAITRLASRGSGNHSRQHVVGLEHPGRNDVRAGNARHEAHKRRSVYFMIKRSKLIPFLQVFDSPEPLVSVGGRPATTVAPQALVFHEQPVCARVRGEFCEAAT